MDPITSIVMALALGAAAGLKPTAEQAVKDAYGSLKTLIKTKYSKVSVDQLEEAPSSQARRSVVTEDLANTNASKDEEVLRKAKELLDAIQARAPETGEAIGVDIEKIKAASLYIEDIMASGAGVKLKEAELEGDVRIRGVRAGSKDLSPKA